MNNNKNLSSYNSSRAFFSRKYICYAPFVNMYFNIQGNAAPCWLGFSNSDKYPDNSISDIWFGQKFENFRDNIKTKNLNQTCSTCATNIANGNYFSVLSKAYDNFGRPRKYPRLMELELDNTCNLECIMCNGFLSSSIRKNREGKKPLISPYDDAFVEQLNEFIPHLKEIRFNGGEPFLSKICMKIIENILRINPKMKIVMATNGTIWNEKIEKLLIKGNFHINLSIDSLNRETYEKIRINGDFETVMVNFSKFLKYCKQNKTNLCILVNPMRQNWKEMPDFVNLCNSHNIPLWFNTIQHPKECSIWALPTINIEKIYTTLSNIKFENTNSSIGNHNIETYRNLVNVQIFQWLQNSIVKTNKQIDNLKNQRTIFEHSLKLYIETHFYNTTEAKIQIEQITVTIKSASLILQEKGFDNFKIYKILNNYPIELVYSELIKNDAKSLTNNILQLMN